MSRRLCASLFTRIGGVLTFPPPLLTHVQTDGSYVSHGLTSARVAAIIVSANQKYSMQEIAKIRAANSTEAEWASVAFGLRLAVSNGQESIGIENDNLSVIHGLIFPKNRLRHEYAAHYRSEILRLAERTAWTGVRWIPREKNRADNLFRLK
jgi:ribonuclease HI